MLPSLISTRRIPSSTSQIPSDVYHESIDDPEDIFHSALTVIFPDDAANQHGDPSTLLVYHNSAFGDLRFRTADPKKEEERGKFAHYLWNAGVLMGELVGGRGGAQDQRDWVERWREHVEGRGLELNADEKAKNWWVSEDEETRWSVKGDTVLELGAGVGLAGIVSVKAGAKEVAITDYPATTILTTLSNNASSNLPPAPSARVSIHGHPWGDFSTDFASSNAHRYTRILAADTLWMPHEHRKLAKSMAYFLSHSPDARVFVIAGFHTGREKMAPFFENVVSLEGLGVEEIWECDVDGRRREWDAGRAEEPVGERKKWVAVARLKRKG